MIRAAREGATPGAGGARGASSGFHAPFPGSTRRGRRGRRPGCAGCDGVNPVPPAALPGKLADRPTNGYGGGRAAASMRFPASPHPSQPRQPAPMAFARTLAFAATLAFVGAAAAQDLAPDQAAPDGAAPDGAAPDLAPDPFADPPTVDQAPGPPASEGDDSDPGGLDEIPAAPDPGGAPDRSEDARSEDAGLTEDGGLTEREEAMAAEDLADEPAAPPAAGRFPGLSEGAGGAAARVRVIRGGEVVAAGTLAGDGTLADAAGEAVEPLPPGVYSFAGRSESGRALFAYRVPAPGAGGVAVAPEPSRLAAPASDWPLARVIVARRFADLPPLAPAPVRRAPFGPPNPFLTPPAPVPPAARPGMLPGAFGVGGVSAVVKGAAAGAEPGDGGRVRQYDAAGVARPVSGAEIYLLRAGERVAALTADDAGRFTLPPTLLPGVYTVVTVSPRSLDPTPARDALLGASVFGVRVEAASPVVEADDRRGAPLVRHVARRTRQAAGELEASQAPETDLPAAFEALDGPPPSAPPAPIVPPAVAAAGAAAAAAFGPGAGGTGLGGGGAGGLDAPAGGLATALIVGGIAAGVVAAVSDDDEEDVLALPPASPSSP